MSAIVLLAETNGPLGTSAETIDPANTNFGSADEAALDPSANPITAKAGGHAYEKWLRLYLSDLSGSSIVDNIKVWLSDNGAGYATGESLSTNARESGYTAASYPAGGPVDSASTEATEAIPESEPSGPNLGIAGSLGGQLTSSPAYSDWLVLQLNVSELTPAGSLSQKTLTFQWDEQ